MKNKFPVIAALVVVVLILLLVIPGLDKNRDVEVDRKVNKTEKASDPSSDVSERREKFSRRTANLIYTRHARCRMQCRHIDEEEVKEILEKGRINHQKTDLAAKPDPKYALEGTTRDGQDVRIIFAPADRGMVVITVIDLEKEWSCNCK